jgi:hypothetical protein
MSEEYNDEVAEFDGVLALYPDGTSEIIPIPCPSREKCVEMSRRSDPYRSPSMRRELPRADRIRFLRAEIESTQKSLGFHLEALAEGYDSCLYWRGETIYIANRRQSILSHLVDIAVVVSELKECGVESKAIFEALQLCDGVFTDFASTFLEPPQHRRRPDQCPTKR